MQAEAKTVGAAENAPLTAAQYRQAYEDMLLIRRFEEKAGQLYGMGLIGGYCHLAIGQEAVVVGTKLALAPGDQTITGHRNHGHMLVAGVDPKRVMAELTGRASGIHKGKGGSMHLFAPDRGFFGGHGIVGAQVPIGTGLAFANAYRANNAVCVASLGDGAADQGQVFESFVLAKRWSLPVVFVIENNSIGGEGEGAAPNLAGRGQGLDIPGRRVDGMVLGEVRAAVAAALAHARSGAGPIILEMRTARFRGHSMADPAKYRARHEVEDSRGQHDPLDHVRDILISAHGATEVDLKAIDRRIRGVVNTAAEFAQAEPMPDPAELHTDVLSAPVTVPAQPVQPAAGSAPASRTVTVREALRDAMAEEMRRDGDVFLIGEEVGRYEGAHKVSRGLLDEFGARRVVDTPITELGFAGIGVGAAFAGLRPIVEFMSFNFALQAIDQIVNSAAKTRYMSGGALGCPLVVRGPNGAASRIGAQHSQDFGSVFAQIPGLKVVQPYSAEDARGLLKAAIRDPDPVIVLENELLYAEPFDVRTDGEGVLPIGKAFVERAGTDVTIVASGIGVHYALPAAEALAAEGIEAEVVNLRTLRPLDIDTIIASVAKTNRCVIVEEAHPRCNVSAEIAAQLMERAFDHLDAPVLRVTGKDVPIPYAANLEKLALPSVAEVIDAVKATCYR